MPVHVDHLISNRFDVSLESIAGTHDFQGAAPHRVSLYVSYNDLTGAPTEQIRISVDLSPDDGQTLIDYDKLLTEAGTDAPVANVNTGASPQNATDVIDISPETVMDYIRVLAEAHTAGATPFAAAQRIDLDCWLVWET